MTYSSLEDIREVKAIAETFESLHHVIAELARKCIAYEERVAALNEPVPVGQSITVSFLWDLALWAQRKRTPPTREDVVIFSHTYKPDQVQE